MFLDKQEQERQRLIKERKKIRDKFLGKDNSYLREPPARPTTFRDQVLRELWEEKHGIENTNSYVTTNMIGGLSEESVGKQPDIAELKKLIVDKRVDLEKLKEQMTRKIDNAKKKYEALKEEERKLKEIEKGCKEVKPGSSAAESKVSEQQEDEMFEDMDEETRERMFEEQRQLRRALEENARRKKAYEQEL